MRKLFLALAFALLPCAAYAQIANVTQQGCVYFSAPATAVNNQYVQVLCDPQGRVVTTVSPTSGAASGFTPSVAGAAVSGLVIKAAAGNLYNVYVTSTAAGWLMVFNSATVPADGATTSGIASGNLQDCFAVPANVTLAVNYGPAPPEVFSVGISAAFSSTGCAIKTASSTAFIHGGAL